MMTPITYRFTTPRYPGNILYVNIIANYACTNDCLFCSRPRTKSELGKENIYEKKAGTSLYLPRSPSIDEVMGAIDEEIEKEDTEIAFVGLGEPFIYFSKLVKIISSINKQYRIKTRIDTNGIVKDNNAAEQLARAGLDEIRISLNAINEQEYNMLCRPKVKGAFGKLVGFVRQSIETDIETKVSFVVGFDDGRSQQEYIEFAESLGIPKDDVILRGYVAQV